MATPRGQLADAFTAATGAIVSPPPPPPSNTVPRRLTSGLMSRSRSRSSTTVLTLLKAGKGGSQVLEANWRDMQPTSSVGLSSTWVNSFVADLDWAHSHGLGVLMRIFAGFYAPTWARTLAGTMTWYTNDGALGTGPSAPSSASWKQIPGGIPCWWQPGYASAYASLIAALAAEPRIMTHPALCGVSMSGPMTQYAEPMVKQFALVENRQSATAAGYSQALDEAAFYTGFDAHKANLSPLKVATYCAFNDYQLISSGGGIQTSAAITVRIMEKMVSTLERMAVVENNSLQYPTTKYPTMYARQRDFRTATPPNPLHYQTETLPKHEALWDSQPVGAKVTSPKATANLGLSWGAGSIEMPTGYEIASMAGTVQRWPGLTVTEATALNLQGWNNTIGLDEWHV